MSFALWNSPDVEEQRPDLLSASATARTGTQLIISCPAFLASRLEDRVYPKPEELSRIQFLFRIVSANDPGSKKSTALLPERLLGFGHSANSRVGKIELIFPSDAKSNPFIIMKPSRGMILRYAKLYHFTHLIRCGLPNDKGY
jgi:hypothetical protein